MKVGLLHYYAQENEDMLTANDVTSGNKFKAINSAKARKRN